MKPGELIRIYVVMEEYRNGFTGGYDLSPVAAYTDRAAAEQHDAKGYSHIEEVDLVVSPQVQSEGGAS